jgi:signal peptidase I
MESAAPPGRPRSRRKTFALIAVAILAALLLNFLTQLGVGVVKAHLVQTYKIPSGSMQPTLLIGDHVFASKRAYRDRAPRQGELVAFNFPMDPRREFISRVVGVGGDRIEIRDKQLFVNGQAMDEPYVIHTDPEIMTAGSTANPFQQRDQMPPLVVPEGFSYVLGDNRDNSYDSRFWGPLDNALITGRPTSVYWSWDAEAGEVRWERTGQNLK